MLHRSVRRLIDALAFSSLLGGTALTSLPAQAQAPVKQPNIVVIMGDDIGMWNIGAYHRGLMAAQQAARISSPASCPSVPA
jgi:arylsulfatase